MSRPLHVLIDALSSYSGGARTSMRYLLPRLVQQGVRLSVACRRDQLAGFGMEPEGPVRWLEVPARVKPLSARLGFSATAVPWMCGHVGADVLFCPTDHAPPAAPCAVTMMIRNPTPYVRDPDHQVPPLRRLREVGMAGVTLAGAWRSQRVILVSRAALDATSAVIPLPGDRLRVVHHGRDESFCPPPPGHVRDTHRILSVSSIYTFKNYPVFLKALHILTRQHGLRPRVDIAGAFFDAAHARGLQQQVEELGLSRQVQFLGEVPHARLVDLYRQATLFVMPSRLETFGHPYVESMATGTAALVGDIPCAREMCGDAVQYADVNSPADFAAKMAALLTDTAARRALEEKGPVRAQQFSWERCAVETLGVLREAVETRR